MKQARVLEADASGLLLETTALFQQHLTRWPAHAAADGPARKLSQGEQRSGRLRIDALSDTILRVRYAEGKSACQAVLQRLDSPLPAAQPSSNEQAIKIKAQVLNWLGIFDGSSHASQLLQQSLTLWDELESAGSDLCAGKAFTLLRLAGFLSQIDHDRAQLLCKESIGLYQSLNDRWGLANALDQLGIILWDRAAFDEARQNHEKSLAIFRELGGQRGLATGLRPDLCTTW